MMQHVQLLVEAIDTALNAGQTIMEVYASEFVVEVKADQSPLTLADKRSHDTIQAGLEKHSIPLISEEGKTIPYEQRKDWNKAWIIDPLDGTKEFVKRNGEFTVNIAMIENQKPILGVVYAPVPRSLYFGSVEIGAYKVNIKPAGMGNSNTSERPQERLDEWIRRGNKLPLASAHKDIYTIVGSRSHGTEELAAFVEQKRKEKGDVNFIAAGSSLKICLVAEGAADIYPRLGPTMEWDTAAGHAIAMCSGAIVYTYPDKSDLIYNRQDQLNPYFVVERAR